MLTYSIKLDEKSIRRDELVWSEKYLAPDRSFVSGVTSQDYHLEKKDYIAFSIGDETNTGSLQLSCNNVTRNGYINIKAKAYDIQSGVTKNYMTGEEYTYDYVEINGVIYYISADTESITVNNWLKEDWYLDDDGEYRVNIIEGDVTGVVSASTKSVYLDTIVWIEDETVTIDGEKYIFDRYESSSDALSPGCIKYFNDGECLSPSAITKTDKNEIYYYHFPRKTDYLYVTKFILRQKEQQLLDFDRISFCNYFYYVKYKDNYCPIRVSGGTDTEPGLYVCDVPTRLYTEIEKINEENYYNISSFTVYYDDGETPGQAVTTSLIRRMNQLKTIDCYIVLEDAKLQVDKLLQNANHGDEIAIYLSNSTVNVTTDDIITLENVGNESYISQLYEMGDELFALYNNKKYKVIDRLCDKVMINNHEYPIEYINGINTNVDCLVDIMGEKVPMKIKSTSGGKYGAGTLERYGETISATSNTSVVVTYDIVPHNGITVKNINYEIVSGENGNNITVEISDRVPFEFVIEDIEGSSLLICEPNFPLREFDDEFRDKVNENICDYFVTNQDTTSLYIKDSSFGFRDITSDVGYVNGDSEPLSSNNNYDLFEHLILYVDTAHIHIPVKFDMNVANNMIQEEVVEEDFYAVEKKRAINPIVDMEKDTYIPKYITSNNGLYNGSDTDFLPISEMEINLHFRTRNLDNWRVNDGNADVSMSGHSDNWFVTDFYPYSGMIATHGEILQNTSDLMGLLYFTNDDIYYQKNKVGKSFLRFSYYDSPDPNTQSLLATSTVFMDEHRMFKKYIDNSRKNIYDYGIVEGNPYPDEELKRSVNNKISVMTELIGKHRYKPKRTEYEASEISASSLSADTRRISSRMIINNKYETDTSSEGFYLYIFKEYSENLHPKPIYMKVEFNHAGVGRTIPFIVPMHWVDAAAETYKNNVVNIKNPDRRLRLSAATDVTEMKTGYPLSYVYAQTYIPLYAVYDFKKKEYGYVFDERYIGKPADNNGRIILNLFELKIADESASASEQERANVTKGRATKALININTKQFEEKDFN